MSAEGDGEKEEVLGGAEIVEVVDFRAIKDL
jgi:hypothetical protein